MFNKEIEFSAHEDYFALKEDYPIPTKLNIPEWYKKLEHTITGKTVKGCMPFLDTITSGYLLKMPQDFIVRHNVDHKNEKGDSLLFHLSPNDLVYVPTNEEVENNNLVEFKKLTKVQQNRIMKFVSCTGSEGHFVPYYYSAPIIKNEILGLVTDFTCAF